MVEIVCREASARIGDGSKFPSAAHFASSSGLAPATKQCGTSIHGEHAARGGNRQLKRATFLSAFAAPHDPASRSYYLLRTQNPTRRLTKDIESP